MIASFLIIPVLTMQDLHVCYITRIMCFTASTVFHGATIHYMRSIESKTPLPIICIEFKN